MKQNILYEDQEILVVYKPAGIATQTARLGQQDMVSELKNYLKNPYLGLIHRLDQPVSGILVFAKNPKAAASLSAQAAREVDKGGMKKHYYAIVCGKPEEESGVLVDYLLKNGRTNLSEVVSKDTRDAKAAKLLYQVCGQKEEYTKLEIELCTGRHHQIRVQLAHAWLPILGDSKYGTEKSKALSDRLQCRNVALCAYKLEFIHPVTGKKLSFTIEPKEKIWELFQSEDLL